MGKQGIEYELRHFDGGWDLVGVAEGVNVMTGATFFDGPLATLVVRLLNGEGEVRGMVEEEAQDMLDRIEVLGGKRRQGSYGPFSAKAVIQELAGLRQAALIMMCQDRPAPPRMTEEAAKAKVSELITAACNCAVKTLPPTGWKDLEARRSRLIGELVELLSGSGV